MGRHTHCCVVDVVVELEMEISRGFRFVWAWVALGRIWYAALASTSLWRLHLLHASQGSGNRRVDVQQPSGMADFSFPSLGC
jgi:hypothetical protein